MLEPDTDQLQEIPWAQPDRQAPPIQRAVTEIADPDMEHPQPVLVSVETPEGLAEGLADAVTAVWTHRHRMIDPLRPAAPAPAHASGDTASLPYASEVQSA